MSEDLTAMNNLIRKQEELMKAAPHPLRKDSMDRAFITEKLIAAILLYINSTGHKPWRPDPLPLDDQSKKLSAIQDILDDLKGLNMRFNPPSDIMINTTESRILVSSFGGIEESLEFFESYENTAAYIGINEKATERRHMLEELTDELFYFLEKMILVNFTWEDVVKEYYRKHAVNMKRYADSKKGDMSWDDRNIKKTL